MRTLWPSKSLMLGSTHDCYVLLSNSMARLTILPTWRSASFWAFLAVHEAPSMNYLRSIVFEARMFSAPLSRRLSFSFSSIRRRLCLSTSLSANEACTLKAVWWSGAPTALPIPYPRLAFSITFFSLVTSTAFSFFMRASSRRWASFRIAWASPKKSSMSKASWLPGRQERALIL